MRQDESTNPSTAPEWWKKAQTIDPDPTRLNITTYKVRSASKFNETDFIYLKAIWKSQTVTNFHIRDYVREEFVDEAEKLAGLCDDPNADENQLFRQNLQAFVRTSSSRFRIGDTANTALGPFLNVKWNLEQTRYINDEGHAVGGDTPKIIRMSPRLQEQREAALASDLQSPNIRGSSPQLPASPQQDPETPGSQDIGDTGDDGGPPRTKELEVISPESIKLDNGRSEDEEIVNLALVGLLVTITLCSGIGSVKGCESLKWLPKRARFQLGRADDPVCEARTDGILRNGGPAGGTGQTLAIVEVKPYDRLSNLDRLEWQEACQIVAWISSSLRERTRDKRKEGIWLTSKGDRFR
ncbi:hypothetical protein F5144DRAFT_486649 [Chaetomium tenue]|uniref:Uncharacterized protein n=1 Tax=Chaetomium tenue TaxID=1854479 RepID=A0ACB7PCA1_9PEZI|nr:hypothetical protein F5144DRAFT_486649 [Chaetomium globosum]